MQRRIILIGPSCSPGSSNSSAFLERLYRSIFSISIVVIDALFASALTLTPLSVVLGIVVIVIIEIGIFVCAADDAVAAVRSRRLAVLDKVVDDPVLQRVHDEREDEHDKGDLKCRVAFGPAERPVADPRDPGEQREQHEDAEFHADETEEVDDGLLEPPCGAWRLAVVARAQRFGRVGERRAGKGCVEDLEEKDKNGDADCRLDLDS